MLIAEKRNIVTLQKKLQEETADLERQRLELTKIKQQQIQQEVVLKREL
jgi:hypothetical protein